MKTLRTIADQLREQSNGLRQVLETAGQAGIHASDRVIVRDERYPISSAGAKQFLGAARCPDKVESRWQPPTLARLFNELFAEEVSAGRVPSRLVLTLTSDDAFVGFGDDRLVQISPTQLVEVVAETLPEGVSAEQIERVFRFGQETFQHAVDDSRRVGDWPEVVGPIKGSHLNSDGPNDHEYNNEE